MSNIAKIVISIGYASTIYVLVDIFKYDQP